MPEKSTRESDPTPPRPSGPSDSQLEAAIEGARDMVESRRGKNDNDYGQEAQRAGPGGAQGGGAGEKHEKGRKAEGRRQRQKGDTT